MPSSLGKVFRVSDQMDVTLIKSDASTVESGYGFRYVYIVVSAPSNLHIFNALSSSICALFFCHMFTYDRLKPELTHFFACFAPDNFFL